MSELDPQSEPEITTTAAPLNGEATAASPDADPAAPPAGEDKEKRKRRARRLIDQDDVPHTAASRLSPGRVSKAVEHAKICARIADDNRAKDILLLDLRNATALVDYFVIVTATSRRQTNSLADEIDQEMKKLGEKKLGMEGSEEGRWVLIDYGDFVVHLFSEDARVYYSLEEIWGDAGHVDWADPSRPRRGERPAE